MTVLEQDPVSVLAGGINKGLGLLSLTLSERNNSESLLVVHGLCKLEQKFSWVSTDLQDEDEWSLVVSIRIHHVHSHWLTLSVESSHVLGHIALKCEHELLTSEGL